MSERVLIFSNGTQYLSWMQVNCESCKIGTCDKAEKFDDIKCPLERAIAESTDGLIDKDIADRLGKKPKMTACTWGCPEKQYEFSHD